MIRIKTQYIEPHIINQIAYNTLIEAETGRGKSTAFIEAITLIEKKREFVVVVPTIQLVKQYEEKFKKLGEDKIRSIYSKVEYLGTKDYIPVTRQLIQAWKDKECRVIILTYTTFNANLEDFLNDNKRHIIFDEAHKLLNYPNTLQSVADRTLLNYKLITATADTLKAVLNNIELKRITSTKKIYNREIQVFDITEHDLQRKENKALFFLNKFKKYGKLVIHYNHKATATNIKELLEKEGLRVFLYNATQKQVKIKDENIEELNGEEWDVLICTSSLTEGVSFRNKVYSIFVVTPQDIAENVPQFLARDRNTETKGAIICKIVPHDTFMNTIYSLKQKEEFINRTKLNLNLIETALKYSRDTINKRVSIELLKKLLKNSNCTITQVFNMTYESEEEKEEKTKLKKPKLEEIRLKWINKKYIKSSFWDNATKLLKIYETEKLTEVEEKAQKEIINKNFSTPKEREKEYRNDFWELVIENRKEFKASVKELIRTKYKYDFNNTTDNDKLLKKAEILLGRGFVEGKKNFYKEITWLLDDTLSDKVVKKDIEYLLNLKGYKVIERRESKKRFYKLELI